ncbi:hypothetical protein GF385_03055 [Candidatus Dependentiae bacterium]|nr:hypothetical protein [Candidatus Dependentiae bacterium]
MKKIILLFSFFILYSNNSSALLYHKLIDEDHLESSIDFKDTLYQLLDCYLSNINDPYVLDYLKNIDRDFIDRFDSSITYFLLKTKSFRMVRLMVFWELDKNLQEKEKTKCENYVLQVNYF